MQLNLKSMKMGWIRLVKLEKFQYHSLTQTIFEMTQFKMRCGTYDPL